MPCTAGQLLVWHAVLLTTATQEESKACNGVHIVHATAPHIRQQVNVHSSTPNKDITIPPDPTTAHCSPAAIDGGQPHCHGLTAEPASGVASQHRPITAADQSIPHIIVLHITVRYSTADSATVAPEVLAATIQLHPTLLNMRSLLPLSMVRGLVLPHSWPRHPCSHTSGASQLLASS